MQAGEVGKALQHETFSVAGSDSTEKTVLREPGPEFTVTAQFSFPPRENPTERPSMTLLPHPGVQSKGESLLWDVHFSDLPYRKPGSWRSCHILKLGKVERWYWAGPPMFGKPCSSYICLQPRNSKPTVQQGESCIVGREWGEKERKKGVGGWGKVSMTVYNLCFFGSLQTYNEEEPWSGTITGLPRLKISTPNTTSGCTAAGRGSSAQSCHPVPTVTQHHRYLMNGPWHRPRAISLPSHKAGSLNTSPPQAITAL